jgi:chromate reductase
MERDCNILLISGSLRSGSTNTAMLRTAAALALPAIATTLCAGMDRLPHFNPDDDREGAPVHDVVAELRAQVAASDALLFCTPEYAGALPGALKNLLEWTVGDAGTYGKPVGYVNASGAAAPTGGADAHESLRKVFAYVGAAVTEAACVRIPISRAQIATDGTIHDADVREGLANALRALADRVAADRR